MQPRVGLRSFCGFNARFAVVKGQTLARLAFRRFLEPVTPPGVQARGRAEAIRIGISPGTSVTSQSSL